MKYKLGILSFFFIIVFYAQAQTLSGKVKDAATGTPLPFAALKLKGAGVGTLSNDDGNFAMQLPVKGDTLLCSYVGYESVKIALKAADSVLHIKLNPLQYNLTEAVISEKYQADYAYKLLYDLLEKYKKEQVADTSKVYLSLLSKQDNVPLELIEAFYNAYPGSNSGLFKLELKNGRIGMAENNGHRFMSLSTTTIISNFSPFSNVNDQKLPATPANFNYGTFKKKYEVKVINSAVNEGKTIVTIGFLKQKILTGIFGNSLYQRY